MSENQTSFEVSLKKLEQVVSELEKGELSLEQQLKSFENGVALSRDCMKRLEEMEKKVELLVQGADGKLETQTFSAV
jgi:exodeoxyribonuclease VII small subunit